MDGALLDLLARWLHFLAGVIWIGHNYSSVVQRPAWRPLAAGDLADAGSPRLQAVINREHGTTILLVEQNARAALEADAKEHGFVVLMECVGEDVAGGGVVIENGEVIDNA